MPETALGRIRGLDYTVIYVRDMDAMRIFYGEVMDFPLERMLGEDWVEYRVGANILALAHPRVTAAAKDAPVPPGAAALQLAFRVAPGDVDRCAEELRRPGSRDHRRADRPVLGPPHAVLPRSRRQRAGNLRGHLSGTSRRWFAEGATSSSRFRKPLDRRLQGSRSMLRLRAGLAGLVLAVSLVLPASSQVAPAQVTPMTPEMIAGL